MFLVLCWYCRVYINKTDIYTNHYATLRLGKAGDLGLRSVLGPIDIEYVYVYQFKVMRTIDIRNESIEHDHDQLRPFEINRKVSLIVSELFKSICYFECILDNQVYN